MDFRRGLLLACALFAWNCKSLDGLSGGKADGGGGATGDAGQQPPCEPNKGFGTLCITVRVAPTPKSPGYGPFAGAGSVGADGKGFVQVFLFDQDPSDPQNGHVLPAVTLRSPPNEGFETTVDDLPQQLVGTAAPGTYYVYAMFADNKTDPRGTGLLSTLPGDLVTLQDISGTTLFPTVTLSDDMVTTFDIGIVPLRKLAVNCSAADSLISKATQNPNIHGDGPAGFFLFDGSIANPNGPQIVDFGQVTCLDLQLQDPNRPALITTSFGSTITGTHNLWGMVFDYDLPNFTGNPMTPGTIETFPDSPPQVTFDETQWATSADIEFVDVIQPKTSTVTDSQHCN